MSIDQTTMSYPGHEITQMILNTYDESDLFTQTSEQSFAIHTAAGWANSVALRLIQVRIDDYKAKNPETDVSIAKLANMHSESKTTALDRIIANFIKPEDHSDVEQYRGFLEPQRMLQRQPGVIECYKMLRGLGAMHRLELNGYAFG